VFEAYVTKVGTVSPDFQSGAQVAQTLSLADGVSPEQLLRGEIAYAAIAALQDPNFVANVRAYAADPQGRESMTARLLANPDYVVAFGGADTAAGRAIAAIGPESRRLFDNGVKVKQAAFDVQSQPWSKLPVEDRPERLARAKNAALANAIASIDQVDSLHAAAVGQSPMPMPGPDLAPPYPPVIVRGLAIAALAALGEAGDDNLLSLAPIMTDAPTATCLHTAKLNLYQCLAGARPNYEDIFCLGQHAMLDMGQCVMIAVGEPAPAIAPPPPLPTPAAKVKAKTKAKPARRPVLRGERP
jgi:hypothetical protein